MRKIENQKQCTPFRDFELDCYISSIGSSASGRSDSLSLTQCRLRQLVQKRLLAMAPSCSHHVENTIQAMSATTTTFISSGILANHRLVRQNALLHYIPTERLWMRADSARIPGFVRKSRGAPVKVCRCVVKNARELLTSIPPLNLILLLFRDGRLTDGIAFVDRGEFHLYGKSGFCSIEQCMCSRRRKDSRYSVGFSSRGCSTRLGGANGSA